MVFGCPICSERLDRVPGASTAENDGRDGDINISSTPCGHMFHAFCINKWLTGKLASSKQCPCCRKLVPKLVTLPLYPDRFDPSLDESTDATGGSFCDHSHFNSQLNTLKKTVENLRDTLTEKDMFLEIQRDLANDFQAKYEKEKERSDTHMFQWRQAASYKDHAEHQERKCKAVTEKLKQYKLIDAMVKNVQEDVKYELNHYPCNTNSLERLLEIHLVIKGEYDTATKKLKEVQVKQETDRQEIAKWRKKYETLQHAHGELTRAHSNCANNSFGVTGTTPRGNKMDLNVIENSSRTPLFSQMNGEKSMRAKLGVDDLSRVDSDILVMQPFNKKKQNLSKRQLDKPNSETQSSSQSSKSTGQNQVSEDEDHSKSKKLKTSGKANNDSSSVSSLEKLAVKPKKHFQSLFRDLEQKSAVSSTSPKSLKLKPANGLNDTILVPDSDEEDLLDIPLRGNIPGLKIERRQTQPEASRKFTFKKKV